MTRENNKNDHGYHRPVLVEETLQALQIQPTGTYVDATFGGGGHSREIIRALGPKGRLIGFDQDADAWANALPDERFCLIPENFRFLNRFLRVQQALPVDGILADLGVSSHQFDTAERGFSIRMDAPLDMRMDRRQSLTAAKVLQTYEEAALWQLLEQYGELRNARSLAVHLVEARKRFPIDTVGALKTVLTPMIRGSERRYLAQVFQALRIAVNDEMGALQDFMTQAAEALKPGGRLVVITFHSVEDRVVKQYMKKGKAAEKLNLLYKKPLQPAAEEVRQNPRAASAKLRAAQRI